ncbi:hypothetical protein [Vibrio phage MZH0603]|nr:hypothetical protein [Vibrio phage MZH0603]
MKEILVGIVFALLVGAFIQHFDIKRYEAEQHAKRAYLDLEVRYKEAEAKIAEQRALELKYACQLINEHGETYTKEEC